MIGRLVPAAPKAAPADSHWLKSAASGALVGAGSAVAVATLPAPVATYWLAAGIGAGLLAFVYFVLRNPATMMRRTFAACLLATMAALALNFGGFTMTIGGETVSFSFSDTSAGILVALVLIDTLALLAAVYEMASQRS